MIVKKLVLDNFRNYDTLELEFDKGLNIIVGDNGSGKTNIVEAIQFLSLARSFRTSNLSDLIKKEREYASISASVEQDTIKKDIVALIGANSKKISINGKLVRKISELAKSTNVIVFEPKDTLMFKDSPSVRRDFFDIVISKKHPSYLDSLILYEKLLKERNKILKEELIDKIQIGIVTDRMIEVEKTIILERYRYVSEVNKILSNVINKIKGEESRAYVKYHPFIEVDDEYDIKCHKAYEDALEGDIKRKTTTLGVHREDYELYLNDSNVAHNGSQGENRMCAIALKLVPYFLEEERGKKPIVVLDDVMSELDTEHKGRLIAFLREFEQVFITSTSINVTNASIYEVSKSQTVTRRNS